MDAVIAEEERIFDMVDEADTRARLDVRADGPRRPVRGSGARHRATSRHSPYLVQPLQAPAGAGKTHSLQALRAAAHRANKDVLVLAPTGKAVDEAMRDEAGDRGLTVAKALQLIEDDQLRHRPAHRDRRRRSLHGRHPRAADSCSRRARSARAKMVLVGDAYQLSPVKARGGMFEQLCADLPWSQRLS